MPNLRTLSPGSAFSLATASADVACQDRRVPVRLSGRQRPRGDVLRPAVDPICDLAGLLRPEVPQALVRLAAEQQGVGLVEQRYRLAVMLVVQIRPRPVRGVDDAVEADEGPLNERAHR